MELLIAAGCWFIAAVVAVFAIVWLGYDRDGMYGIRKMTQEQYDVERRRFMVVRR